MDTSPDSVNTDSRLSISETGVANEVPDSNLPPNASDTDLSQEQNPADALSPIPVASVEASEPGSPRSSTTPTTVEPGENIEHAYWAEFEEDTTTPSEEELKEIDGADADYSACDREFHVVSQESDLGLLMPCQTRIGRVTSSGILMTPSMCPGRRPV